jgi:AraC-like DNA-binding protein
MGNGSGGEPWDSGKALQQILAQGLKLARMGGGGEITRFVCGYMACEPRLSEVLLGGLPPLLKVNIRNDAAGEWLENTIRFSVDDVDGSRAGSEVLLAKLSEVLFIEMLRRYVATLPSEQTGWLAGARDEIVGRTLALMHRHPGLAWTLAELAKRVGSSRSVLAERFHHYLGEPPIAYLTRWRLRLGAELLASSACSVAEIAAEVGYESEAAFNRAFKREFATPPARFRARTHEPLRSASGTIARGASQAAK